MQPARLLISILMLNRRMIEEYCGNDYDKIINIWELSVKAAHSFLSESDFNIIKERLPDCLSGVRLFVYIKGETIAAFMGIKDCKLEMLFCYPRFFRQGIGSAMVKYAIDVLNVSFVDVNEDNTGAIDFYKSLGFEMYGRKGTDDFGYPILLLKLPNTII